MNFLIINFVLSITLPLLTCFSLKNKIGAKILKHRIEGRWFQTFAIDVIYRDAGVYEDPVCSRVAPRIQRHKSPLNHVLPSVGTNPTYDRSQSPYDVHRASI